MPVESTIHPHLAEEVAFLFTAENGGATEEEYLGVLAALVRALKCRRVLETGAWTGSGTLRLARAMEANGFGELHTVDLDPAALAIAKGRIDAQYFTAVRVHYHAGDSLEFVKACTEPFGLVFLDSALPLRALELAEILERGLLERGGVAVIHDTSRLRITDKGVPDPDTAKFWSTFDRKVRRRFEPRAVLELPLSRGMTLVQV